MPRFRTPILLTDAVRIRTSSAFKRQTVVGYVDRWIMVDDKEEYLIRIIAKFLHSYLTKLINY